MACMAALRHRRRPYTPSSCSRFESHAQQQYEDGEGDKRQQQFQVAGTGWGQLPGHDAQQCGKRHLLGEQAHVVGPG